VVAEKVLLEGGARAEKLHELMMLAHQQQQMIAPGMLGVLSGLQTLLHEGVASAQWPEPEGKLLLLSPSTIAIANDMLGDSLARSREQASGRTMIR
jgi:hypothetical protein